MGDALEQACDVLLHDARGTGPHGGGVHLVADGHRAFDFGDFLVGLDGSHGDDGLDERHTGLGAGLQGMDAQQVAELDHVVVAIGWEVVNLLSLCT